MKIAFISYEYPPDAAYGGIATYVYQVSRMMNKTGHHVEVFASSPIRFSTEAEEGIIVHRINEVSRENFSKKIAYIFKERNDVVQFDIIEGPEFCADAKEIVKIVSNIALVVKLHTPSFFTDQLNPSFFVFKLWGIEIHFLTNVYRALRSLRWQLISNGYYFYNRRADPECIHTLSADEVVTPSKDLGYKLTKLWKLNPQKVAHIPYVYEPSKELLSIPIDTQSNVITFIGRLETRKGILDLARAIPLILMLHPKTKFRFVGRSDLSPIDNLNMRQYLELQLYDYRHSLEFTGSVSPDEIPKILSTTDICVFPSIWENLPFVCFEAMAAARGIVGSNSGGMTELLNNGEVGRLVPPHNPRAITVAVSELLKNPLLRMQLGESARNRVLSEYSIEKIAPLQEASYKRAIKQRKEKLLLRKIRKINDN
jgi:glycogen synthase